MQRSLKVYDAINRLVLRVIVASNSKKPYILLMDRYQFIKSFLRAIESLDLEKILSFFASNAEVESPVLGRMDACSFYKEIVAGTEKFKFTVHEVFAGQDNPSQWCVLFKNDWTMKSGQFASADVIMWLSFEESEEKIISLQTFYHSFEAKGAWAKSKATK